MQQTKINSQGETINKEELLEKIKKNDSNIQIVNVLSPDYYQMGSIQGSLKIPLDELDERLNELDKSKEVITYCANTQCSASTAAAEMLAEKGFNVRAYKGGMKEWNEAGFPKE